MQTTSQERDLRSSATHGRERRCTCLLRAIASGAAVSKPVQTVLHLISTAFPSVTIWSVRTNLAVDNGGSVEQMAGKDLVLHAIAITRNGPYVRHGYITGGVTSMHDEAVRVQIISQSSQCRHSYTSCSIFPSFLAHLVLRCQCLPLANEHLKVLRELLHSTGCRRGRLHQQRLDSGMSSILGHLVHLDNNRLSKTGNPLTPPSPKSQAYHLRYPSRRQEALLPHQLLESSPYPPVQAQHLPRYHRRKASGQSMGPGRSRNPPHPRQLSYRRRLHSRPRFRQPTALHCRRRQALPHRPLSQHLLLRIPPRARCNYLWSTT